VKETIYLNDDSFIDVQNDYCCYFDLQLNILNSFMIIDIVFMIYQFLILHLKTLLQIIEKALVVAIHFDFIPSKTIINANYY
jgi:hypothetical protein